MTFPTQRVGTNFFLFSSFIIINFEIRQIFKAEQFTRLQFSFSCPFSLKGDTEINAPVWLALVIFGSFLCFCAWIYSISEGWDYWTACYFTFITFTTIGLGDIVPERAETVGEICVYCCRLFHVDLKWFPESTWIVLKT